MASIILLSLAQSGCLAVAIARENCVKPAVSNYATSRNHNVMTMTVERAPNGHGSTFTPPPSPTSPAISQTRHSRPSGQPLKARRPRTGGLARPIAPPLSPQGSALISAAFASRSAANVSVPVLSQTTLHHEGLRAGMTLPLEANARAETACAPMQAEMGSSVDSRSGVG